MLDIFSGLRLVVKRRNISIDNAIFRCHWFFTSTLLVSFSLIITARQYVGQPIECHSVNKIPDSLLNSYCWVQSTFTVPQACNLQVGLEVPYPCIDNTRGREIKMFAYYQWVGMVLFIQGLLFHLPYYLWKVWENGLIKAITGGLRVAVLSDQERSKKRDIVVDYIHDHLGCHKRYALKYFLCELICLINLLAQLWATNKFFDGQFLRYGLDVMHYSSASLTSQFGGSSSSSSANNNNQQQQSSSSLSNTTQQHLLSSTTFPSSHQQQYYATTKVRGHQQSQAGAGNSGKQQTILDPMTYIFPRITKCTYYDFGSSGDIQKHDALCLLPLNIINEKIYIALWFWFLILAILTLLVIIYRLFAILSENVRCKGLISRCKLSSEQDIRVICKHCDVGDWFLFYMVAENLDPLIMREIVGAVADRIRQHFEVKRRLMGEESLTAANKVEQTICDQQQQQQATHETANGRLWAASLALISGRNSQPPAPQVEAETWLPAPPTAPSSYSGSAGSDDAISSSTSRRNSMTTATLDDVPIDEVPLVKKMRKRLYNKRLWSAELGPSELRQQLFGAEGGIGAGATTSSSRQPATNPDHHYHRRQVANSLNGGPIASDERTTGSMLLVGVPPVSHTTLGLAPPLCRPAGRNWSRRASSSSLSAAGSDSFIMDMAPLRAAAAAAPTCPKSNPNGTTQTAPTPKTLERQQSGHGGSRPLLRHRNQHSYQQHAHHQSIASMQELRLDAH